MKTSSEVANFMLTFLKAIARLQWNLHQSRAEIDHLRNALLQQQILSAYQQVPFYRQLFDRHKVAPHEIKSVADLGRLPIITKEDIRENQSGIMSRQYNKARCYRSHTSGSTGEPTWTYYNRRCWYRKKYFSKIRARMVCGLRWGQKVAILESEATRKLRVKNAKLSKLFIFFPIHYLSIFEPPEHLLDKLIEYNPQNIYGPPSCLFLLAKRAMQTGKRIPALERVFTSSEYLTQVAARYIEQSLGVKIYDVYGSTETKELAWQCSQAHGYHVNEDEAVIEIVDDEGRLLPPGSPGHIVVTDLKNRAMPLIRYRNYDQGILQKDTCPCNIPFVLMKPLNGRASEYIRLPDGRHLSPFLFTTSIEKTEGLLQYQIIQERFNALRVKSVFKPGFFPQGSSTIQSILMKITENTMTVDVEDCDQIVIGENGKLKVVKNEVERGLTSA